ncbi:hypothetical protein [Photobacterium nomapromontoriensis]|uniref:hypothetical protein n=1 Tax=Photobacterium nomapromontoriensis TaxID=2910237 RepID=UPI003D0FF1F8
METNDKLLDTLLKAFDDRIQIEKGDRQEHEKGSSAFYYSDGRVDGVDTGRAIVESVFIQNMNSNSDKET